MGFTTKIADCSSAWHVVSTPHQTDIIRWSFGCVVIVACIDVFLGNVVVYISMSGDQFYRHGSSSRQATSSSYCHAVFVVLESVLGSETLRLIHC